MPLTDTNETKELANRLLKLIDELHLLGKITTYRSNNKHAQHLNVNQLLMMRYLRYYPGSPQKALVQELEITPASVSVAVREMEQLGLIKREQDSEDKRSYCLYLTIKGESIVQEIESIRQTAVTDVLKVLPLDQQYMIVEIFERAMELQRVQIDPLTISDSEQF